MNYLSAENLTKSFSEKFLFENLTFGISKGQRLGLIASNGQGKSTLLNILVGRESPDSGVISIRKDIRVTLLDQNPEFNLQENALKFIIDDSTEIGKSVMEYEAAVHDEHPNMDLIARTTEKMDVLNAWEYESQVKKIMGQLGLKFSEQPIANYSGGERRRLALAKALIEKADLLILDEPTNHLDIQMIKWLENFLVQQSCTLLIVSHDRYFLDVVCDSYMELADGELSTYSAPYAKYLESKQLKLEQRKSEIVKSKNLMRKELEWMRRQPKARGTKSKSRIADFYELADKAGQRIKDERIQIGIKSERLGNKIIELHKVSKSFDNRLLIDKFSYQFLKGERVGIIGTNGSGKTTLLNLMMGKIEADQGKVVRGETVKIGYFGQELPSFKKGIRVIDVVKDIAEVIPLAKGRKLTASQLLERFLFDKKDQYKVVDKLSGGEKRRLHLMTVFMANPNFLILDEPTNDLDIPTLNELESFLSEFPGCILFVSHDRYFTDNLADHLFVFQGNGLIKDFPGNYSLYLDSDVKNDKTTAKKPEAVKPKTPKKGHSYKEKMEYESLEQEIEVLENEKAELNALLQSGTEDYEALTASSTRMSQVQTELETKMNRWIELDEKK